MSVKVFLDTNVIVHYIILKNIHLANEIRQEELFKEYKNIKPSYDLISLISNNSNRHVVAYISNLALAEIFHALRDEYRCKKMNRDGVPLSRWPLMNRHFQLLKDDIDEIELEISSFSKYFGSLKEHPKRIKMVNEQYNFKILSSLTLGKGIRTHDAILCCTALKNKCKYFCTCDHSLRDFKKINSMEICSPEKAIDIYKSITN